MTENETQHLYDRVLSKWGRESQMRMVQEECAELIVAINKWWRSTSTEYSAVEETAAESNVAEEIADVEIMCGQMRNVIGDERINEVKTRKLQRLKERLDTRS